MNKASCFFIIPTIISLLDSGTQFEKMQQTNQELVMGAKQLNTVIIDDDPQSRKLLTVLLKKFPEINVVGEAENLPKAVDMIQKKNPDSVFLDVRLNEDSGFELMKKIKNHPKVIFVSAYDQYALQAFDVNALDYIQKPIVPARLEKTIRRLIESVNQNGNGHSDKKEFPEEQKPLSKTTADVLPDEDADEEDADYDYMQNEPNKVLDYDDRLFITFDGVSKFIKVSSIICITAEKDYSYIYAANGKKHLVLKSMVEWEERLTPKYFVRIHRSTIVNLEFVEKVEKWFNSSYHVYLQNHQQPYKMSRRYAAKLKERFK